ALGVAEARVVEATATAAAATTLEADLAEGMPPLRLAEAEAAARLHRLGVAREQLDAEMTRLADARREAERRRAEILADEAREQARLEDAGSALERLREERLALETAAAAEGKAEAEARAILSAASSRVNVVEAELARRTAEVATLEAGHAAAVRQAEEGKVRCHRLAVRIAETEAQRVVLSAEDVGGALTEANLRLAGCEESLHLALSAAEEARTVHHQARESFEIERDAVASAAAERARIQAEVAALVEMLDAEARGDGEMEEGLVPVLEDVTVTPGYEAAVAAALGEGLLAPVGREGEIAAGRQWNLLPSLSPLPSLPVGCRPLADFVEAPGALARRLALVGLVEVEGGVLQPRLSAGQRLVSMEGDLWRWDGFAVRAGSAPSTTATRLRQRNRLVAMEAALKEADSVLVVATGRMNEARAASERAASAERRGQEILRLAEVERRNAQDARDRLNRQAEATRSRLDAIDENLGALRADLAEATAAAEDARAAAAGVEELDLARQGLAVLRADAAEGRTALVEARSAHDRLVRDAESRRSRREAIGVEAASWQKRATAAEGQLRSLRDRLAAVVEELEHLAERPLEIDASRGLLLEQTVAAEETRREAADRLAVAETRRNEAHRALRAAEAVLAAAREDRVRGEALMAQGREACRVIAGRIAERLACTPEQVPEISGLEPGVPQPSLETTERQHERLLLERETLGPVNLRAEVEAEQLEGQIAGLTAERKDLVDAIARLRQGIAEINREGRERLMASFQAVDGHFRRLFGRLFGGGRAHLSLTESQDPLQAGLEIMASPPGKRLQILSLLSGGEQALTALSLLFAVFLTNPAPICVLDEVDAPLDDANVDRFCALLSEITRETQTRFLIVTHHRMTMARMDRLYGVTMGERGVSQLVSVDLKAAEKLRDPSP
ncbi:MAG: chromosome partitioning protein ParA, partial [Alphaproteobacteria bacterium]